MSNERMEGELDRSESDEDSDSDEESICDSINGSVIEKLSVREHTDDGHVDFDEDLTKTCGGR